MATTTMTERQQIISTAAALLRGETEYTLANAEPVDPDDFEDIWGLEDQQGVALTPGLAKALASLLDAAAAGSSGDTLAAEARKFCSHVCTHMRSQDAQGDEVAWVGKALRTEAAFTRASGGPDYGPHDAVWGLDRRYRGVALPVAAATMTARMLRLMADDGPLDAPAFTEVACRRMLGNGTISW